MKDNRFNNLFNDHKEVKRPPSLGTLNGVGATIYGRRDYDSETKSYIKTHVICVLFFPIFAIGSYRVIDAAEGGWYFLAKVPLSGFAKFYNYLVLIGILLFGFSVYNEGRKSSPEYIAAKKLETAAEHIEKKEIQNAAEIYLSMIQTKSLKKKQALEAIVPIFENQFVKANTSSEISKVALMINALHKHEKGAVKDFENSLYKKFTVLKASSKIEALKVLKTYISIFPKGKKAEQQKIRLLEEIVKEEPDNHEYAVELALIYDASNKTAQAINILKGREKHILKTPAAVILGKYYYKQGNMEKAFDLLKEYLKKKTKEIAALEKQYDNVYKLEYQRRGEIIARGMNINRKLTEQEIQSIRSKVEVQLSKSPKLENIRLKLVKATEVVPLALDLGAVQLGKAQSLPPGKERDRELQEVEKQFLAIRSFAGESNEYKFFLGQVYYWLGKDAEASKLFHDLEKKNQSNGAVLLAMAKILREVGEDSEARRLAEKVFNSSTDKNVKSEAAIFRALVFVDLEDELEWLKKSPIQDERIQVNINDALGRKSLEEGNLEEAEKYFRKVISSYEKLPKSSVTFNNMGLIYQRLYEITYNVEDFRKGCSMMQAAVKEAPDNSILLQNTYISLQSLALLNSYKDKVKNPKLFQGGLNNIQSFMHNNKSEKDAFDLSYKDETYKESLKLMDKAVLLSPKKTSLLLAAVSVHAANKNLTKLQEYENRVTSARLNLEKLIMDYKESLSMVNEEENIAELEANLKNKKEWGARKDVSENNFSRIVSKSNIISIQQDLFELNCEVDLLKMLDASEKLMRERPCSFTRSNLINTLQLILVKDLLAKDVKFQSKYNLCRQALTAWGALLFYFHKNPGKIKTLDSEVLSKLVSIRKKYVEDYKNGSVEDWVFFSLVDKPFASKIKNWALKDTSSLRVYEISYKLMPYIPTVILTKYYLEVMRGSKTASHVLAEGLKTGVPMGFDSL